MYRYVGLLSLWGMLYCVGCNTQPASSPPVNPYAANTENTASQQPAQEAPPKQSSPQVPQRDPAPVETSNPFPTPSPLPVSTPFQPQPGGSSITLTFTSRETPTVRVMAPAPAASTARRDPETPWTAWVDAPPAPLTPPEKLVGGVPLPAGAPLGALRVLYPQTTSRFVALGVNEGATEREVWDLASHTLTGRISGLSLAGSRIQTLSPDGRYFAAHPAGSAVIGFYDISSGNSTTIPANLGPPNYLALTAQNQVIFVSAGSLLSVWTISPFQALHGNAPLPGHEPLSKTLRISPGGNLLTYADIYYAGDDFVTSIPFLDLTNLSVVGKLIIGPNIDRLASAFSPDGTKFAVVFTRSDGLWVQVWDPGTGSLITEKRIDTPFSIPKFFSVEWFPDQQHLLICRQGVVDSNTGQLTGALPGVSPDEVRPVQDGLVMALIDGQLDVFQIDGTPAPQGAPDPAIAVPPDQLPHNPPSATTTAEIDATLPPLTPIDRTSGRTIDLTSTKEAWDFTPKPYPETKQIVKRLRKLPEGDIHRICITGGDWPYAAVMSVQGEVAPTARARPPAESPAAQVRIDWYELRNGAAKNSFELPFTATLEGLSPEGQQVVTRIANGMDRFDVWSLDDGAHQLGFRPHQSDTGINSAPVEAVAFVDEKHLFTKGGGRLILWKIPACEAIYEVEVGRLEPLLSPAGDSILVTSPDEQRLCFLNALTGDVTFVMEFGSSPQHPLIAVSFSPDGRELIGFLDQKGGCEVVVQELVHQKEKTRFRLPVQVQRCHWIAESFVLVDQRLLISLLDEAVAWKYELPNGGHVIPPGPGSRHWYWSHAPERNLRGVRLPSREALQKLRRQPPKTNIILQPGDAIAIRSNLNSEEVGPQNIRSIYETVESELVAAGFEVRDRQPVELSLDARLEPSGTTLVAESEDDDVPTIRIPEVRATLALTIRKSGEVHWQQEISATNDHSFEYQFGTLLDPARVSAANQCAASMWMEVATSVHGLSLPTTLFDPESAKGLGASTFSAVGVLPADP